MINVFGVERLGRGTPPPLAGAQTPPWWSVEGGGGQSSHCSSSPPCVNRKSLLLSTRSLLLHGQFLSVRDAQCYLAGCAVNVNLSLNPLLKGEGA